MVERASRVMVDPTRHSGIGMTSARTRERLIARLREQGITNPEVLERIRSVPRHLFVDEALASRAYDDTALPIGHGGPAPIDQRCIRGFNPYIRQRDAGRVPDEAAHRGILSLRSRVRREERR